MSHNHSQSIELSTRVQRVAVALAILAAHGALVYAAASLRPVFYRAGSAPVTARFIDAPRAEPEWTPPSITPMNISLEVPIPLAPAIEVPVEPPTTPKQIIARAMPISTAPNNSIDAPKLVSAVEYVREPSPRYPPQSRRLREQGLVVLRVLIDEKGQACSIEVETSSGHSRLDHAAKEAVARAAFRPYVEDGEPRRALVLIPIEFSLSGRA